MVIPEEVREMVPGFGRLPTTSLRVRGMAHAVCRPCAGPVISPEIIRGVPGFYRLRGREVNGALAAVLD